MKKRPRRSGGIGSLSGSGSTRAGGADDVAHGRPVLIAWRNAQNQNGADFAQVSEVGEPDFTAVHSSVSWFSPPSSSS